MELVSAGTVRVTLALAHLACLTVCRELTFDYMCLQKFEDKMVHLSTCHNDKNYP